MHAEMAEIKLLSRLFRNLFSKLWEGNSKQDTYWVLKLQLNKKDIVNNDTFARYWVITLDRSIYIVKMAFLSFLNQF